MMCGGTPWRRNPTNRASGFKTELLYGFFFTWLRSRACAV
jgi:hypothetical protein